MTESSDLLYARHALLAHSGALPLSREGIPLRKALREAADDHALKALIAAWDAALFRLHEAGLGTDDPLAAALVANAPYPGAPTPVRFLPEHIFPLGALVAKRPIAVFLDRLEARRWLRSQGLEESTLALLHTPISPWPGYPEAPSEGLTLVLGPVAELHALCHYARLSAVPLHHFDTSPTSTTAHTLSQHLQSKKPLMVLCDLRDLGQHQPFTLAFERQLEAKGCGAIHPLLWRGSSELETVFGLLSAQTPTLTQTEQPPSLPRLREALEVARLQPSAPLRAQAEAEALLDAYDLRATQLPTSLALSELELALGRAREGLDRHLAQQVLIRRAIARLNDPKVALGDLLEARRLGQVSQTNPEQVQLAEVARALRECLHTLLELDLPLERPLTSLLCTELAHLFQMPLWAEAETHRALALASSAHLDAPPSLAPLLRETCLLLCLERIGRNAIVNAHEESAERALNRMLQLKSSATLRTLNESWVVLLAARRGALGSARERLVHLTEQLDSYQGPWLGLTLERSLYTAHLLRLDGLSHYLSQHQAAEVRQHAPLWQALTGQHPLYLHWPLPRWLCTLALEDLLSAPESELRRFLVPLEQRELVGEGLKLAYARALVRIDPSGAEKHLRELLVGEPHAEAKALRALLPLMPESEARQAAQARLDTLELGARWEEAPLSLPPLTTSLAEERVMSMVEGMALAFQKAGSWAEALEALLGPAMGTLPESPVPFELIEESHGRWRFESALHTCLFSPPPASPLVQMPQLALRALRTLSPLKASFIASETKAATPEDARLLERALRQGERHFFDDLVNDYKAHRISRDLLRDIVHEGLVATGGVYRSLAQRWGISDYQRLMDFLRRNQIQLDYRRYRKLPKS